MNRVVLTGRLLKPAIGFSEGRVFKFVIVTESGPGIGQGTSKLSYVPCVVFEPNKELEAALMDNGATKYEWEMQGRVVRSRFDNAEGERRYATEVVVDAYSVRRRS